MTPRKFRIQSGGMDRTVEADSPEDAAAVAVRLENDCESPAELGYIIDVVEIVDGPWLVDTEAACRAAGVWRSDTA